MKINNIGQAFVVFNQIVRDENQDTLISNNSYYLEKEEITSTYKCFAYRHTSIWGKGIRRRGE